MKKYTINEISKVINGKLNLSSFNYNNNIHQVITDSRYLFDYEHAIFFAIKGVNNDGHNFINQLISKGVQSFVISDPNYISDDANFIVVDNVVEALQQLAIFYRQQYQYPVIGITGSKGKTYIKEWLYQLLNKNYKIIRSPKGYNSQIGVPLSILLMRSDFNLGIFTAGISNPGEMDVLGDIVQPTIGVFSNINDEHSSNFKDFEEKIENKLQLFKNTKKLVFCSDNELLAAKIKEFCRDFGTEPVSWSLQNDATINFTINKGQNKTSIKVETQKGIFQLMIPFNDNASIENACHCFVVSYVLMPNVSEITDRFELLEDITMQLEIKKGINNTLVVHDYYNSDLNSIDIALSTLNQQAVGNHRNKVVILSDLKNQDFSNQELYAQVNEMIKQWNINQFIGIGEHISICKDLFSIPSTFYSSVDHFIKEYDDKRLKNSAILLKGSKRFNFERIANRLQLKAHTTVLEIDMDALAYNLAQFRKLLNPTTKVIAMVKAFSYGSGDVEVAQLMEYIRVDYLAIAVADEAVRLRKADIKTPLIVMNPELHSFQNIIDYEIEVNIYSISLLQQFIEALVNNDVKDFPIHIKIDTGMNRLGLKDNHQIDEMIKLIKSCDAIKIKTIFSHLAASDDPSEDQFTRKQIERFEEVYERFAAAFNYKIERHILNSSGIERFIDKQFDYVRLGIGLYGVSRTNLPLKSISSLKSVISQIKRVKPRETVGYGRKEVATQDMVIAIIPLGYADGINRKLGNRNGSVYINGSRAKIIGNICMDMLMIDITSIEAKVGDRIEIFGENISINEMAKQLDTIPYEILTSISQRVKRVYLKK